MASHPRRRAAVLGSPIDHSLSPVLHRAAYAALGLDWDYSAVEVAAGELGAFVDACGPEWVGLSLTMPLKVEALALLGERSDDVARTEAANTLVFRDGVVCGFNTDVTGIVSAVKDSSRPALSTGVILGAGATAASALAAMHDLGLEFVTIAARSADARDRLIQRGRAWGMEMSGLDLIDVTLAADLVVTTVPASVGEGVVADVPGDTLGLLFDVVYDPWPTPLAHRWEAAGGVVLDGMDLLAHQAVGQLELMTGQRVDVGLLLTAGRRALAERSVGRA